MASNNKRLLLLFVCVLVLALGIGASAQELESPDWRIFLDDYGYTDLVTVTFPGDAAHEVLTGDWSGAVRYDGVSTSGGESMLIPPFFFRPFFATNSTFLVDIPITTFHDPANPVPGSNSGISRIANENLLIDIKFDMKLVPGGMAIGLNPGGVGPYGAILSSPYVMFQTYNIQNIGTTDVTNLSLFQLLHAHPNDNLSTDNFACYDSKNYGLGSYRDYRYDITTYGPSIFTPEGSDVVGFSANTAPVAHAVGHYDTDLTGIVADVYADALSGQDFSGPTNVAGAMKFHWPTLAPNQSVSQTFAFWVAHFANPPIPPSGPTLLQQAYEGDSNGANQHFSGFLNQGGDTISAVPGVFKIIPGDKWANFVSAAQMRVPYDLKNVTLTKQTPDISQCADVFPSHTVSQQGTNDIRLWWPLMYEIPGTTFTLNIVYGTPYLWDDDGFGPKRPSYVHSSVWRWQVDASLESMKDLLALFHELPFGLAEVPLISDEVLYPQLVAALDDVASAVSDGNKLRAANLLADFDMRVMDACIADQPWRPMPTGPGTGIANSREHPACCKILADTEYVGRKLELFLTAK